MSSALDRLIPSVCDVSVTNICNADCDFCGFARSKTGGVPKRYIDPAEFARALPILHRRGVRYITFQGGEPLAHPGLVRLVSETTACGIQSAVITNGWFLDRDIGALAQAGLKRLLISIDSAAMEQHEKNRGLPGLERRLIAGIGRARGYGIPVWASVTVSRLVKYEDLPATLKRLGFDSVSFSFPRREPFGSTSLVYDSRSKLIDLSDDELLAALASIETLKRRFPVMNPRASLAEVARYVRGEPQSFACVGGYKYFYLDWNLDIWRCEAWNRPLGSVFDFENIPDQREPCHACMMGCYRTTSALMHAGIATLDSLHALASADLRTAAAAIFRRSVAQSLWAVVEQSPQITAVARHRRAQRAAVRSHFQASRGRKGPRVEAGPATS
jgi:MoaA/NifB/PqqE/SkfB family radical SAM enzyme